MTTNPAAPTRTFSVPDMSCDHCVQAITTEVGGVAGVESVVVDLDTKTVTVAGGEPQPIIDAIDEAGFDTTGVS